MRLYHGTFEEFYKGIESDGAIKAKHNISTETDLIDVALNDFIEDINLRDGAIYLFNDEMYTKCYDYMFCIDVENLNKNLLYVADFRISTDIYAAVMRGKDDAEIKELCQRYVTSFMSFGEYLVDSERISIPEFLYYGEIDIKNTEISDLFDMALERLGIIEPF